MDPLSIVATTVTLGQAVDRITTLMSKIKRYRDAPEDISVLITEITDLRLVLDKLQSTSASFPLQDLPTLKKLLDSCNTIVHQIEVLIRESFVKSTSLEDSSEIKVHRFAWVKKKHEIDRLRQQLRDSRALLALQLVGVNASFQSQVTIALPQLVHLMSNAGQCVRIKELLANSDASPADIVAPYGITALCLAIYYGRPEICSLLIAAGAHPGGPNVQGRVNDVRHFWTRYNLKECSMHASQLIKDMLYLCARDRHLEALPYALSGPIQESMHFPRLHKSVLGITTESVEKVVRKSRADINDTDLLGRTALHWAVCKGDPKNVERLLHCGADPDIRDRDGKAPLHLAAGFGFTETAVSLVAAGANLELQDCLGNTPIHHAAMQGHTSIIELLVDAEANFESLNGFGETPLISSTLANEPQAVHLLYGLGANIEHRCNWKYTPIGKAIKVNAYEVIQALLRMEARTDIIPADGKTLLHLAAQSADAKTLKLLVSSNISTIDEEALDAKGFTALQYLRLRSDQDALLEDFEKLMLHAACRGLNERHVISDLANEDEAEDFFDAVEFW